MLARAALRTACVAGARSGLRICALQACSRSPATPALRSFTSTRTPSSSAQAVGAPAPQSSSADFETSRRALLFRSQMRGVLELDLLLGNWTAKNIKRLNEHELRELDAVLLVENPDLQKWLFGIEAVPETFADNSVLADIIAWVKTRPRPRPYHGNQGKEFF
eukprot:tig00000319_g24139.t1